MIFHYSFCLCLPLFSPNHQFICLKFEQNISIIISWLLDNHKREIFNSFFFICSSQCDLRPLNLPEPGLAHKIVVRRNGEKYIYRHKPFRRPGCNQIKIFN